mgnify:CR=1 FL=1
MLVYPWSKEGAALALPRIQQIFKRWAGGQITLGAAAQSADTASSHQKLNITQLIEKYRSFVPNAGENTWKTHYCRCCVTAPRHSKANHPWTAKR